MAARREVPTATTLLADTDKLYELLRTASDLAVAIVMVSYLDASLGNVLRSVLANRKATDSLLDIDRPLESFGARCQLARAMNLISETTYRDLKLIGKIRNRFAHHHFALTFDDEEIGRLCDRLSLNHDPIDVRTGKPMKMVHVSKASRVRGRFLIFSHYLSQQFLKFAAQRSA